VNLEILEVKASNQLDSFNMSLNFFCLCIFSFLYVTKAIHHFEKKIEMIETRYGKIRSIVMFSAEKGLEVREFPVIGIHGANSQLKYEWEESGALIANHSSSYVMILDLHSNPQTAPGACTKQVFDDIMQDLIRFAPTKQKRVVLLGKSWGGGLAATWASMNYHQVLGIVLAAPVLGRAISPSEIADRFDTNSEIEGAGDGPRVLMLFCADDPVFKFDQSLIEELKAAVGTGRFTLYVASSGGHRVVAEYETPIQHFIQDIQRPMGPRKSVNGRGINRTR